MVSTMEPNLPARHPLWRPYLTVFISSLCIMVLELVAARLIAPFVGSSLYTWTTVIGVVLTGISIGNYVGGRLADRRPSVRLLASVFLLAGLLSLLVLPIAGWLRPGGTGSLLWRVIGVMSAMFLLPCLVLGCVSPLVARLAVHDLARAGRTVGRIYAVATMGSIIGTVGTGFWLIPALRVDLIVIATAGLLLLWGLTLWIAGTAMQREATA